MRSPLPVGGTWSAAPNTLSITFDERIAYSTAAVGQFTVEGTPTSRQQNQIPATIAGRRVSWVTTPILGLNLPPLRVTYTATLGAIVGVGGGTVAAFADFPLTLV